MKQQNSQTANILAIECKRAFIGSGFWLSLLLGSTLAIIQYVLEVIPAIQNLPENLEYGLLEMMSPAFLYSSWLGGKSSGMLQYLYFLLLPIMAVLPYGDSFFLDVKGGLVHNICIRTNKKAYYLSKYFAVFLSGGIAVTLPLLINFLLSAAVLPGMNMQPSAFYHLISNTSTFPNLFYQHPVCYVALYLFIIFVFSGFYATLAPLMSYYTNYRFLVLVAPFIFYLFLSAVSNVLGASSWDPINFLLPGYYENVLLPILVVPLVIGLITFFGFVVWGEKDVY